MILLLACQCGGVVPLIRGVLKESGIDNWLDEPIYQGKRRSIEILEQFPDYYKGLLQFGALYDHISNHSSFAVIVGYDADNFRWADVSMGDIKSKLDGEIIATNFATKM